MSLGIPIESQDVPARNILNPLFQIVQMVKIIETEILADDVVPILPPKLLDNVRTEQAVQAHDLDESRDFGPLAKALPFLAI